jgi:hypothetical protein
MSALGQKRTCGHVHFTPDCDRKSRHRLIGRLFLSRSTILAATTSCVPCRHMRRVRRPEGAPTKELVVVVGVDVMSLHYPHQMHRIGAAGKAAISVVYVVADRLGAGEPFRADPDRADAMFHL